MNNDVLANGAFGNFLINRFDFLIRFVSRQNEQKTNYNMHG